MNKLKIILLFFSITACTSFKYTQREVNSELQFDDLYSAYTDNDGDDPSDPSVIAKGPLAVRTNQTTNVDLFGKFVPFEQVVAHISPYLEEHFDTFIIGNTATSGSSSDIIPFQHVRVLHKKNNKKPIFKRKDGVITGINFSNVAAIEGIPELVPVSTGTSGNKSIRTFSGVFRVNTERSKEKLNTSASAGMSYQVYIHAKYEGGRESGLAIHGTPKKNHKFLGQSRQSHGCFRTFPKIAKAIHYHVMSDYRWSDALPKFDLYENFPSDDVMNGRLGTEAGSRTLFIIFNGYQNQATDT